MRRFLCLSLLLAVSTPTLAGGGGRPPTARVSPTTAPPRIPADLALRSLTGVQRVEAPPSDPASPAHRTSFNARNALYTLAVQGEGRTERVLATPGSSAQSETITELLVFVQSPRTTRSQRAALVRVALGFLNTCWPSEAEGLDGFWSNLITQDWQRNIGMQEDRRGVRTVEWSGREGLYVAGQEVTGLRVSWKANGGRCTFR